MRENHCGNSMENGKVKIPTPHFFLTFTKGGYVDFDIQKGILDVTGLVANVAKNLPDPLNDLSDLASHARTLRLSAEALETYIGVQHARYEREGQDLAEIAGGNMRNNPQP